MRIHIGHIKFDDFSEYSGMHTFSCINKQIYDKFFLQETIVRHHIREYGEFTPLGEYDGSMYSLFKDFTDLDNNKYKTDYFHVSWFFIQNIINRTYYPKFVVVNDDVMNIVLSDDDESIVPYMSWLLKAFGYDVSIDRCCVTAYPGDVNRITKDIPELQSCRLNRGSLCIASKLDNINPGQTHVGDNVEYNGRTYRIQSIAEYASYEILQV